MKSDEIHELLHKIREELGAEHPEGTDEEIAEASRKVAERYGLPVVPAPAKRGK
jgi:hypothetical protein